jgi:carbonic anhydrase
MGNSAKELLDQLLEGNRRFAGSSMAHPHHDTARRTECITGQKPYAAILGCADSRVPPEVLFDCGIGDLFIIRNAGTVLDDSSVASIEYAIDHLKVPLLMVLGHTSCGAVTAAVKGVEAPGALGRVLGSIRGKCSHNGHELDAEAINSIVKQYTVTIAAEVETISPVVERAAANGSCTIVAACYSLADGLVTVL